MNLLKNKYLYIFLFSAILIVEPVFASKQAFFTGENGYALRGYDVVAYFTEGRAVMGSNNYIFVWKEIKWKFSSSKNLLLFKSNPKKYAPQYGGYCAYAVANGYTASTDNSRGKTLFEL